MSPPTFSAGLEQDLVQRVGTRLQLSVTVEPDNKAGKVSIEHRRRINTEEKAKVIAAVWGQDFFNSLPR